jgi:hypothetical protein
MFSLFATACAASPQEGGGEARQGCLSNPDALVDSSPDVRERTARAMFQCDRSLVGSDASVGGLLRESIKQGNSAAAATLLLAYFPGDETIAVLTGFSDDSAPVKLENWMTPVPATLAASVSLARLQYDSGKDQLLTAISRNSLEEQVFLLSVMSEIEDRDVIQSLATHLSDQREVRYGVPSGATPRRRLCDMAVDSFVNRLDLEIDFRLTSAARYNDLQIDTVIAAVGPALDTP